MLSKKIKIICINLGIFLIALTLIELFFTVNSKYNFVKRRNFINYDSNHPLSPSQFKTKYGFDLFGAPDDLKIKPDPRIKLLKLNSSQLNSAQARAQYQDGVASSSFRIDLKFLPPNEDIYIYSADYIHNKNGTRKVEFQDSKKKSEKFVLTIGDSFTYGEGVSNGNELASQLTKKISNKWKVYNYGIRGASVNSFLFNLQTKPSYLNEIKEKSGIVIWYYIDDQFERFFCNLLCYQRAYSYIKFRPRYEYVDNDFIYKGTFEEATDPYRHFLKLLGLSEALKFSGFAIHQSYSQKQIDIFAKSFQKLSEKINEKLNAEKFYVVFMDKIRSKKDFIKALGEQKNISVLDFTDIPLLMEGQNLKYPLDGHPTPEFYWVLTEALKNKIDFK